MTTAHHMVPMALKKRSTVSLTWSYCRKCGRVALKNEASRRALRKPCDAKDD